MRTIQIPREELLPIGDFDGPTEGDAIYKPIMKEIGLQNPSKEEIDALRDKIEVKLLKMGEEYKKKTLMDLLTGKLKRIEDAPLYRKPDGQGGAYLCNIPDDYMKWVLFEIWLNELSFSME